MDGAGIISSEPAKEEEMSKLVFGFSAQVRKRLRARRVSSPSYLMGSIQSGLHQMKRTRRTGQ